MIWLRRIIFPPFFCPFENLFWKVLDWLWILKESLNWEREDFLLMGSGDVHSRFWLLMKSIFVRCWLFISTHWSDATINLAARRELLPREDKISG